MAANSSYFERALTYGSILVLPTIFRDDVQNVRASKLDFSENQVMSLNSVYFFTESEITFAQCQKSLATVGAQAKRH